MPRLGYLLHMGPIKQMDPVGLTAVQTGLASVSGCDRPQSTGETTVLAQQIVRGGNRRQTLSSFRSGDQRTPGFEHATNFVRFFRVASKRSLVWEVNWILPRRSVPRR